MIVAIRKDTGRHEKDYEVKRITHKSHLLGLDIMSIIEVEISDSEELIKEANQRIQRVKVRYLKRYQESLRPEPKFKEGDIVTFKEPKAVCHYAPYRVVSSVFEEESWRYVIQCSGYQITSSEYLLKKVEEKTEITVGSFVSFKNTSALWYVKEIDLNYGKPTVWLNPIGEYGFVNPNYNLQTTLDQLVLAEKPKPMPKYKAGQNIKLRSFSTWQILEVEREKDDTFSYLVTDGMTNMTVAEDLIES